MSLVPYDRRRGPLTGGFFGGMMDDFFRDAFTPFGSTFRDTFKVDVKESDAEYTVMAEMPGVQKDEISLDLRAGTLTVSVARDEEKQEEKDRYIHKERRYASMRRSLYLPGAADEGVDAELKNGVLTVIVPKGAKPDPAKKIEIR